MSTFRAGQAVEVDYYGWKIPGVFVADNPMGLAVRVDPTCPEARAASYLGCAEDLWHPTSVTETALAAACRAVAADQRRSFPEFTDAQALHRVRNTLVVDDLDGDPGDPTYDAYRLVLEADMGDLLIAL